EETLLRAVAEHALVVDGASVLGAAHAQLLEQLDHLDGARPRRRQVVRAERAAHAAERVAATVAARRVLELEDAHVVHAGARQRRRRAGGEHGAPARPAAVAHRCTCPHSSSNVCTSTWLERRFTSAGTRAMSGGNSKSGARPSRSRKRSPAGSA